MVRVSCCTSTENRATLPGNDRLRAGTLDLDGIADPDVAHRGLRNRDHQTKQIILG